MALLRHYNTDFLQIPDGCLSIATGMIENGPNLVFVGGTCSIYGYDVKGNDQFWTVCTHLLI